MDARATGDAGGEALQARYAEALAQAAAVPDTRALPPWMRPRLPGAIGASLGMAAELAGALPEALAKHYLEDAPRALVEQRLRGSDPARRLLWRPLEASRLPGFCAAFDASCALLRDLGIDPERVLPAPSAARLLAGRPCALELASGSLLASGLPLLGAGPAERSVLEAMLAAPGAAPDAALDHHLGQHLLHELLHGRAPSGPAPDEGGDGARAQLAPPWLVREAAALWLQARAWPRHVFPELAGEAIPGVSLFVLAGEGLAAALGEEALLSALADPAGWSARVGEPIARLLAIAEWQEWRKRQSAPFAQDALRAMSWSKLAAAAPLLAGDAAPADGPWLAMRALLGQAAESGLARAVRELPSLLDLADALPWSALPAWSKAPEPGDERRARLAVAALFQENALAPTFVTRPAELRDASLRLDVERCELRASPRPSGVFGEPARWLFPPALCRSLHARGVRQLEVRGARRGLCESLADSLVATARGSGALAQQLLLTPDAEGRWTSSPR